ncbi:Uncharacterised protein [Mycobacterium tuberculosis]|nr:Uncharacterised protein [Mycobacterium tuberculosis]
MASSARSVFSRPLPAPLSTNSWIWPDTCANATPLSRTILRKKKSCAWMAVVPSYRESILASRMYCSIG